ncbi:MAG: magnesium/cobalt transporter CorA [Ignavibacteria bacterium]|jgi:magnesium transporter
MDFLKRKLNKKVGAPPGEIVYSGEGNPQPTKIVQRIYNKEKFTVKEILNKNNIRPVDSKYVNWVDIQGFENIELIKDISSVLNLHHMLLEDIMNTNHIPKYEEDIDKHVFIVKAFLTSPEGKIISNHICVFLNQNNVLLFHEKENDFLDTKIDRISKNIGKARSKKADYLFYVLLDAFIDSYYLFFDNIRSELESLEEDLLKRISENLIDEIHSVKKELSSLRNYLFPLRDAINQLTKFESKFIDKNNEIYFKDLKDHVNELIQNYNTFNEFINSLVVLNDTNLNNISNNVMKVLTIIATIFIPLTFIAGLYGMNFKYMPELEWSFGYPVALGVMAVIGVAMFIYMKRKKWF